MATPLTLIKLGGSVITNKEVPMMVREQVLRRLVVEIARAQRETGGIYIIGHGQGSFAHSPALRYKTMEGFINGDSRIGMAITQDSAAQLNRIVVRAFLSEELPAVSFYFSNSLVTADKQAKYWCGEVLLTYLEKKLLPITGGDVIVDEKNGCTIWSTEKILAYLAQELPKHDYAINRIIHVSEVPGVLDAEGKVIAKITPNLAKTAFNAIGKTKGFDVTGGMKHKLEESLALTEQGITSVVISGMERNSLYQALVSNMTQTTIGTVISHN